MVESNDDEIFERSAQNQFGKGNESIVRKEVADRLEESTGRYSEKLSQHEKEDIEKRIVFEYAKEKGLWIENFYTLGYPMKGGGNENTLALNPETGILYKSNNLFNSKFLVSNLLKQIDIHNQLFPETSYQLVGFTGLDNGNNRAPYIEVILQQSFVPDAVQASSEEIACYMNSIGFQMVDVTTFSNGFYMIEDLFPRNVLKDMNDIIYVVDNIIRL